MSCNCGKTPCRCPKMDGAPKRAYIDKCTDCDPCKPCDSMVKICSFVVANIEEGQTYRNSFVYNQQDDAVYYISDDGTPTRFGATPMFINAFDPEEHNIPRQTIYDFMNEKAYVYDATGNYRTINLGDPVIPEPEDTTLDVTLTDVSLKSRDGSAGTYNGTLSNSEDLTGYEVAQEILSGRSVRIRNLPLVVDAATYAPLDGVTLAGGETIHAGNTMSSVSAFDYSREKDGNREGAVIILPGSAVMQYPVSWAITVNYEKEGDAVISQSVEVTVNPITESVELASEESE